MGKHQFLLMVSVFVLLVSVGQSDFASDRDECADALVGLAPCLDYVTAAAKAPTPDCCKGLEQVIGKTPKCLCVLVKDRDNPELGFKINATRAISMPITCKTGVNTTQCIDLLHLKPSSPEAQIFKQAGAPASPSISSPAVTTNETSSGSSSGATGTTGGSSANEKSMGRRERWALREMFMGFVLIVCSLFNL